MKKRSLQVALAALSCALATIFLTAGIYVPFFLIAGYVFATIALMLPLSRKFYVGGFLAYAATCLLVFAIGGGVAGFYKLFPFLVFFGLLPLANSLQERFRIPRWIGMPVKIAWLDGTLCLTWLLFQGLFEVPEWAEKYIWLILLLGGAVCAVVIDLGSGRCQKIVDYYVSRADRGKRGGPPASSSDAEHTAENIFPELGEENKNENEKKNGEDGGDTRQDRPFMREDGEGNDAKK